ncbi:MAG: ATP-binding protein [Pseudomonadota bacterium]
MYATSPSNKRRILIWLGGFALAWILTAALLQDNWQYKQGRYLDQHASVVATAYRASVDSYALATRVLFTETINKPNTITIFARGIDGDPAARGQLYRLLAQTYDDLVKQGIRQLHFHTSTGHSYLRFHALDKFGDPLFDVRPSLRIANTEKRMVFGFEAGRIVSGFRYVFPLFDQDRHLGSVETSVTFRSIRETMTRIDPGREYAFVLRRDSVENVVFADTRNLYVPWPMNADYFVEDPELKLPDSPPPPTPKMRSLDAALASSTAVHTRMAAGDSFTLPMEIEGEFWAVSFSPVADVTQRQVAYVVSYTAAPYLGALRNEFIRMLALATLALATLLFLAYRLWQAREQQTREAEHLRTITDTIADGIYVMDARGTIRMINPAFEEILGYAPADVIGKIGHDIFHAHAANGDRVPHKNCPIFSVVKQGGAFQGDEIFRSKAGALINVGVASRPILDRNHRPTGISVTAFRDISVRKQTEATLLAAKNTAEAANRAKSEFLSMMSHEIRTPMNGVIGMAQLLLIPGLEEGERLDYARTILNSGQTLLNLLNDILDLSKIEAGRIELEDGVVEPRQILRETALLFAAAAADKKIALTTDGPEGNRRYRGDSHRLRQMLANLVGNAVKFTHQGEICLSVREIESTPERCMLEFSVRDTGIGIPADKLSRLFQPFTQVDSSITREYGGTGLGLSIVRSLAHMMKGETGVDSQVGQGSRFWFSVALTPLAPDVDSRGSNRDSRPTATHDPLVRGLNGRILVVEDNRTNRLVIGTLLGKIGLTVDMAENGQEGVTRLIKSAETEKPDLILMDVQMPVLDGLAATAQIRQWELDNAVPRIPIIALTADAFAEDRERCLAAGMDDYLAKPIDAARLRETLAHWLGRVKQ